MKALFRLVPLCLLGLAACKRGPGSSCEPHEMRCVEAKSAMVCDDGKFVEVPCRGKAGCATVQEATSCDISGNRPGDACSSSDEGVAVCLDATAMLACHGRAFERVPCRGPKGCEMAGGQPSCDQSVAEAGEACKKENAKACSGDKTQVLSCHDGHLVPQYLCRGEQHCSSASGKLACDESVARLGDRCDKALNGHIACSEDKKSLITCQNEEFVPSERCKPGTLCSVSGQSTKCEKP